MIWARMWCNLRDFFLGGNCPDCNVRPLMPHKEDCPTVKWDSGTWA